MERGNLIETGYGRQQVKNVQSIEILGAYINNVANDTEAMEHRTRKAEGLFWKYSKQFKGRGDPMLKMRAWLQTAATCSLHGAGTWAISETMLKSMRAWEDRRTKAEGRRQKT